jgi:outer membrane protein OmpA-like peptidoglycan-associated protein
MNKPIRITLAAAILSTLGACATVPPGPPPEVVRLENEVNRLHNDPRIAPNAPSEIAQADSAVRILATDSRHMDPKIYQHQVYIADRLIQTAEADGLARYSEIRGKDLGVERDRLIVESRNGQLRIVQGSSASALAAADAERRDAAIARQNIPTSQSDVERLRVDLANLQAQQTQHGFVVTLGDVLFEANRSELRPGASRTLDQLVLALSDDPRAVVTIDGHTDAGGNRDYNMDLSLRRAQSVRNYLAAHGINPSRLSAQGLGSDYPIASNDTELGRQQNRRVEVVVQTDIATR